MFRQVFPYELKGYGLRVHGELIGSFIYVVMKSRFWGNRIISLPFSDEGGIVLRDFGKLTPSLKRRLYDLVCQRIDQEALSCRAGYAEIRGDESLFAEIEEDPFIIKRKAYVKFILSISSPYNDIRKGFHSNIINNLKKADRCIDVRECLSGDELEEVYKIYLIEMRRLGGLPLPVSYFEILCRQKTAKIFLAVMGGKVVGFLMVLLVRQRILADINASLPSVRTFFPKMRLYDAAIRWGCDNGFLFFDFMRTRSNSGLYWHKKKWGGQETPIFYYTRLYDKRVNYILDADQKRFHLARLLIRQMPLCLFKNIGIPVRLGLGK